MPWFKVDDGFPTSRQVLKIPRRHRAAAAGVWTLAGAWSSKELTDGFIPDYVLPEVCGTPAIAALLIDAGLWEEVEGGWQFLNWEKHNPTAAAVQADRAAEAERKRAWREQRKAQAAGAKPSVSDVVPPVSGGTDADVPDVSDGTDASVRDASTPTRPYPTRPDPSLKEREPRQRDSAAKGERLPEGWRPPDAVVAAMHSEHPNVDLRAEHQKFVDYWNGVPGAKGRKSDWPGTWRNWIRRAAENTPRAQAASPASGPSRADQKVQGYLDIGARLTSPPQPQPQSDPMRELLA
ncbi:hypothetical protein [Nocardia sp. NPDC059239]|uniref:hypothetical protein n=1 Tax=unclassified Nocardia TaxID=2637762 RepID=UPI0036C4ECCB